MNAFAGESRQAMLTLLDASYRQRVGDMELVRMLCTAVPEVNRLLEDTEETPETHVPSSKKDTFSQRLARDGGVHVEFDKGVQGALLFFYALDDRYEAWVRCQKPGVALTREGFREMRQWTLTGLHTIVEAMKECTAAAAAAAEGEHLFFFRSAQQLLLVFIVLNDIGKVRAVGEEVRRRTGTDEHDHDKLFLMALRGGQQEDMFPSVSAHLTPRHLCLKWICDGLETAFLPAQMVQGENVPASAARLQLLSPPAQMLYLMHSLYDLAGAAGHVNRSGSVVYTQPVHRHFMDALRHLRSLRFSSQSASQVYRDYYRSRAEQAGVQNFDQAGAEGYALARLCCMLRADTADAAEPLMGAAMRMRLREPQRFATLLEELHRTGEHGGVALLVYYAPALLLNASVPRHVDSVHAALHLLSRVLEQARRVAPSGYERGVFTVNVGKLAEAVKPLVAAQKYTEVAELRFDLSPAESSDSATAVPLS